MSHVQCPLREEGLCTGVLIQRPGRSPPSPNFRTECTFGVSFIRSRSSSLRGLRSPKRCPPLGHILPLYSIRGISPSAGLPLGTRSTSSPAAGFSLCQMGLGEPTAGTNLKAQPRGPGFGVAWCCDPRGAGACQPADRLGSPPHAPVPAFALHTPACAGVENSRLCHTAHRAGRATTTGTSVGI